MAQTDGPRTADDSLASPEPAHLAARARAHGKLGFGMCVALVVGNTIGAGAFQLPASLAPLGWNSIYGWLVSIGGTMCLAWVFARLARVMPGGCGAFSYANAAFGPLVGFLIAWSYWISVWTANATLAIAAVGNLSILFPGLSSTPGRMAMAAVAPIWIFTIVNCLGVRRAGGVQSVTTLLKIVPLIGAIGVAAWLLLSGGAAPVPHASQPISTAAIGSAATITLFALLGFESALMAADRVEDAERTVPRATLVGTALTGVIYLFACSAVTLLLPAMEVTKSSAPFALFFSTFVSPSLGAVIALFVVVSALGALNGYVLLQGELLLALARQNMIPSWFARENRHATPHNAHIVSSALASLIVIANFTRGLADLFTFMVLVTTSVSIIFYLAGTLASLKLARDKRFAASHGFLTVAALGLGYSVWTFYGAGLEASIWSLAMTAAGLPIYILTARARRRA